MERDLNLSVEGLEAKFTIELVSVNLLDIVEGLEPPLGL